MMVILMFVVKFGFSRITSILPRKGMFITHTTDKKDYIPVRRHDATADEFSHNLDNPKQVHLERVSIFKTKLEENI